MAYLFDLKYILSLTSMSIEKKKKIWREYARLEELERIKLDGEFGEWISKNKGKMQAGKQAEFYYSMRLLQINNYFKTKNSANVKDGDATQKSMEELTNERINLLLAKKGTSHKTTIGEILRVRYLEIKQLKARNLSWKDCSEYLKTYGALKVAPTYLRDCILEIEKERNENNAEPKDNRESKKSLPENQHGNEINKQQQYRGTNEPTPNSSKTGGENGIQSINPQRRIAENQTSQHPTTPNTRTFTANTN